MIDSIILILYLLISFFIFLISNYSIFLVIFLLVILMMIIFRISIIKYLLFIKKSILFLIFIFICNIIFSDLNNSLLVIIRLFLILNISFLISFYFNYSKINNSFYYLLYPLKIFKVDIKKISMIIAISLSFIPVFIDEIEIIKMSLLSMGLRFNIKNVVIKPHVFIISFINGIFDRVFEIENYLKASCFD